MLMMLRLEVTTMMGFQIKPMRHLRGQQKIGGSQCTLLWQVDDIKTSHIKPQVVTDMLESLDNECGAIAKLVVTWGKMHDHCLGMTINFEMDGAVKIEMKDCVKNMLTDLPNDMSGEAITPAGHHLFEISDDATKLDDCNNDIQCMK
jgi:hypothetical protein